MANTTKSHRLKRKRGKKFVWHNENAEDKKGNQIEQNPFEEHSKSKKYTKDLEKRQDLLDEYRRLGKNSSVIDNRIAEKSSKMSEDDKMKLRYIAEQRNRAMSHLNTKTTRKREKFNLDSDESDGGDIFLGGKGGFTHKGKPLIQDDDFDEKISQSSDDGEAGGDKGKLTEEMVNTLNFGMGDAAGIHAEDHKKTRKEIFEEIIEKSKAYKFAYKEMKNVNQELIQELDDDYADIIGKLDFTRKKNAGPAESSDPKIKTADEKGKGFDVVSMMLRENLKKATPVALVLSEHDKAAQRKKKIEETLQNTAQNSSGVERKRDQKLKDKREVAIEKALKEQEKVGKDLKRAEGAGESVANKLKKVQFDEDLQSGDEQSDEQDGDGDDESGEYEDGESGEDDPDGGDSEESD